MAGNKRTVQEINAGSMADISFLLLIFFLVATTMNTDAGLQRMLPPMPDENQQTQDMDVKERNLMKVYISKAYGAGEVFPHQILGVPLLGEPNSCCSETYIVVGAYKQRATAENIASYIRTRFFRFLVLLLKNTQDAPRRVYRLVPMQDFSKPWTDAELYAKYGLNAEDIAFVERMVKPMEK